MTPSYLPLLDMANRHRGLTQPIATSYLEAARVCLDRHHTSPTEFVVQNGTETVGVLVEWEATAGRSRGAWANYIDATEAGAYACALAAVELAGGLVVIRRAATGAGADYYIGPPDQSMGQKKDIGGDGITKDPSSTQRDLPLLHDVPARLPTEYSQAKGPGRRPRA